MPVYACFTYSADLAPSAMNRNAAQRAVRDHRSMPGYPCFAYPGDIPLSTGNRAAQPGPGHSPNPPGGRPDFVAHMCFSYPSGPCFRY
jgi:hypothetical protein